MVRVVDAVPDNVTLQVRGTQTALAKTLATGLFLTDPAESIGETSFLRLSIRVLKTRVFVELISEADCLLFFIASGWNEEISILDPAKVQRFFSQSVKGHIG